MIDFSKCHSKLNEAMIHRLFSPRRVLLGYFLIIFLALVWLMFNAGSWCPKHSSEVAFSHDLFEDGSSRKVSLAQWHRELSAWQQKLIKQERMLRHKYHKENDNLLHEANTLDIPTIYAITPTYARPVQKAELTRLAHTFMLVPNFHWIIIEDSAAKTSLVTNFLRRSGLNFTHLNVATPSHYKMTSTDPNWLKPRGVLQRNAGIQWIKDHFDPNHQRGVVYFADDDNTYDLQIFEEMRWTRKVSVWPVGLVGYLRYEAPVVTDGKVVGWFTYWEPNRPFAMDMAGFAVNAEMFFDFPDVAFKLEVRRGYQETELLRQIVTMDELEPKADSCTKILVWHTRTERPELKNEEKFKKKGLKGSDPNVEV